MLTLLLTLLLACAGTHEPPVTDPVAPPPPEVPAPPPPETGETGTRFVATWTSAECGERTYERRITLNPDFSFVGEDLVSPCPPDAACIWSGIVTWSGSWAMEGPALKLTETSAIPDDQGMDRPTELKHNRGGQLTEQSGELTCPYSVVTPAELPTTTLEGPL
jgi:hypothetical protein